MPSVPTGPPAGQTPEEAAEQFEHILVKQFVSEMTKGLFEQSLAGDEGPGWMDSYSQQQGDVMADVLTEHLVETGAMGIREMLLRQWGVRTDEAPLPEMPPEQPLIEDTGLTMG